MILCAMQGEADAIIERLGMTPQSTPWPTTLPPRMWAGDVGGERVFALIKIMFGKQQISALADMIQAALMLRSNKRHLG